MNAHRPRFRDPRFSAPYGQGPEGRSLAELLGDGMATPPLTPEDMQQLWAEGLVPPEFAEDPLGGYGLGALGTERDAARRIFAEESRLATSLPDMPEDLVARRGAMGDAFRGLQPNNLGQGTVLHAGTENTMIVQARGLDCLTPVGIALGYNVMGQSLPSDDIFVQALIKWGVGGAQHEAWVDVGRGTQVRLPSASFVSVQMNYLPDPTILPARTGPDLMGIALLGYGTPSFRASPARFTQRIGVLGPKATSSPVPIPKFAQSYGVIGELGSVGAATVTLLPNLTPDAFGHTAATILADSLMESQYYIPNGFRALQINNNGISQAFNVVYTLML